MNRPKKEKKTKTQSKAQVRDLKPSKDAKGGEGPSENISFTYTKPQVTYKP